MTEYEAEKIESFDFGEFLLGLKIRWCVSYSEIARRAKIPRESIYKYTSGDRVKPSLVDFIKIMQLAGVSLDEWYYNLMGMPNQMEIMKKYVNQLSANEMLLIDRIEKVDPKIREKLVKSFIAFIEDTFINL